MICHADFPLPLIKHCHSALLESYPHSSARRADAQTSRSSWEKLALKARGVFGEQRHANWLQLLQHWCGMSEIIEPISRLKYWVM